MKTQNSNFVYCIVYLIYYLGKHNIQLTILMQVIRIFTINFWVFFRNWKILEDFPRKKLLQTRTHIALIMFLTNFPEINTRQMSNTQEK